MSGDQPKTLVNPGERRVRECPVSVNIRQYGAFVAVVRLTVNRVDCVDCGGAGQVEQALGCILDYIDCTRCHGTGARRTIRAFINDPLPSFYSDLAPKTRVGRLARRFGFSDVDRRIRRRELEHSLEVAVYELAKRQAVMEEAQRRVRELIATLQKT